MCFFLRIATILSSAQKDEEIKCLNAQVEVLMRTLQGKED